MSGAFYAIFVVGILVVIQWYVANERVGHDSDGSKGLLAMRQAREPKADTDADKRRRANRLSGLKPTTPKSNPR